MPKHVVLNNVEHKDVKVVAHCSAEFGHDVSSALVFPTEFRRAQCEYPILFVHNAETKSYQSIALFGLQHGENLFLGNNGWQASYIPHTFTKGPFSVGLQTQMVEGSEEQKAVLLIDMEDKRVNTEQGHALFKEFGGNTPYIDSIQSILVELKDGMEFSEHMFAAYQELDLIEPITLKLDVDADNSYQLEGYSTISTEKLAALQGEQLELMHKHGYLELAYSVIASLENMQKLVNLKKAKLKN